MDRWACVDVRLLALQLLLRREPEWRGSPVAVVARDGPQGELLQVNETARRLGVRPGQRLAAALSLTGDLRAAEVSPEELAEAVARLTVLMQRYSPAVEPAAERPGTFWLRADGLGQLIPTLAQWAGKLRGGLSRRELAGAVAVGFTRFGVYAAARVTRTIVAFDSPGEEAVAAAAVPLAALDLSPKALGELHKLGIDRVAELLRLPPEGLGRRFGAEVRDLRLRASGALSEPLQAAPEPTPCRVSQDLEPPERNHTRLLFRIKGLLHILVREMDGRGRLATGLWLRLQEEHGVLLEEEIRPAEPTRDEGALMELVRLRLETLPARKPFSELQLELDGILVPYSQLPLLDQGPSRDPAAANRAIARVRAEFGNEAVVQVATANGHLPEASWTWLPFGEVVDPRLALPARKTRAEPLIRRVRNERWRRGQVRATHESRPYRLSGGWWTGHGRADREYRYAVLEDGRIAWLCRDRTRDRWTLAGTVE